MPILTSVLLLVFSVLYLGKTNQNKVIKDFANNIAKHQDAIGYWSFLYGILAMAVALLSSFNAFFYISGFYFGHMGGVIIANLLLIFLSAPLAYPKIKKHLGEKHEKIHNIMKKIIKITNDYNIILAGLAGVLAVLSILL